MTTAFFDTNVLLYLLSADAAKADQAEALVGAGGCISVQVLNEFASVASRKLRMSWAEIDEALAPIRALCTVVALTQEDHDHARQLAAGHSLSFYDALIVASALRAQCSVLVTEDLQHGQVFARRLKVRNPFRGG